MQFRAAMADMNQPGAQHKLSVANSLWLAEWFEPRDEYVETARVHYDSRVESLDLAAPAAAETINGWVADNTGGKIREVLSPGSTDGSTALVMANAVYFNDTWRTTFDESVTNEEGSFWVAPDRTVSGPAVGSDTQNKRRRRRLGRLQYPCPFLFYSGSQDAFDRLFPETPESVRRICYDSTLRP